MYQILIVEDDDVIASAIEKNLNSWGYTAKRVTDFQNVLSEFAAFSPHLVLLDISLPFYNGYHWCKEIRKNSKVPIIFISSAAENMNIIMAVNAGADDFIAKPFDFNVFTAKVQAILRRTYDFAGQTGIIEHKGAILNVADASFTYNEQKINLTKNEFRIVQTLMENKQKIVSRDTLMIRLWETDSFVDDNTLTVNMTRLRKKMEIAGLENFIMTKKGIGYLVE